MRWDHTKKTILVIDDDPDWLAFMSLLLSDSGFNIILTSRADEALRMVVRKVVDVVVSDTNMPVVDGLRLLRMVKGFRPTLPVVIFYPGFLINEESPLEIKYPTREEILTDGASAVLLKDDAHHKLLPLLESLLKETETV